MPISNHIAGIIVSNSSSNTISNDLISANLLDGIILANTAQSNTITDNMIGTDVSGTQRLANTADGVFLIGGTGSGVTISGLTETSGTISGNMITDNTISGNAENGVQIFGKGSTSNTVSDNVIGLGTGNSTSVFNGGNGVYLNDDGRFNTIGPANVISNNKESGVLIFGTLGDGGHDLVVGNFIGTDANDDTNVGNGGNGVFIYGTSSNVIGGTVAGGVPSNLSLSTPTKSNLISGNAQAGVDIFSPAYVPGSMTAPRASNIVAGNLIGANAAGTGTLPNDSDGIDIFSRPK